MFKTLNQNGVDRYEEGMNCVEYNRFMCFFFNQAPAGVLFILK